MRKITSLLMLFCAFVCSAFAAATDLPELSTDGNIKLYAIKSLRSEKYANYVGDATKMSQVSTLEATSLFYFTAGDGEAVEGFTPVKIHAVGTDNLMNDFASWTADGHTWYVSTDVKTVGEKTGRFITKTAELTGWNAFNEEASTTITNYSAEDAGSVFVFEAVDETAALTAFAATKTSVGTQLGTLATLPVIFTQASTLKTEVEALTATNVADIMAQTKVAYAKLATAKAEANGKNVKLVNNGSDGRNGRFLGYDNANNRAAAVADGGDAAIWTIKLNADGSTFKLYNWVNDIYLGTPADETPVVTGEASAPSFTFIPTAENQVALATGDKMVHIANHTNYKVIHYWSTSDGASLWDVTVVPEIVVSRDQYNAAAAAKATLPWGIQQAYGLVTDASNYYSNYKSEQEGTYAALLDNVETSYFHSAYGSEAGDGSGVHYIQADLGEGNSVDQFYFYMLPRSGNSNNRPKNITIYGSNDINGEFTKITDVTTTLDGSMNPYMSAKIGTQGTNYRYIRFTVTSTNTGTKFFTLSELYILPASVSDVVTLVEAYNNFATTSITSNDFATVANALVNGEATLALSNIKKEIAALLEATADQVAAAGEAPKLGQYPFENYQALDLISATSSATQETLEQAIVDFNKSKNVPVYFIASAWDGGYPKGSAIYYDDANSKWKWTATNASKYNRDMWMTIQNYAQENVPTVNAYDANGTSYEICDYTTGKLMRDKKVQIVAVPEWDGVFSLQYDANANSTDAAHHAQNTGNLVNWKPAAKNDCQASAWTVEYIGTSYELDKLTDDLFTDLVALNTTYAASKNAALGEGLGYYTDATGAFATAQAAAKTILDMTLDEAVNEDAAAAKTALETANAGLSLNVPAQGKFYRFSHNYGGEVGNLYVQAVACDVQNKANGMLMNAETGAASIFYYANDQLLSYSKGLYVKDEGNARGLQAVGVAGGAAKFEAGTVAGQLGIYAGGSFHANTSGDVRFIDHCGNVHSADHNFTVEEVTSLPVTITAAGYASFYAPVAVEVADGLTAYYVSSINGDYAIFTEIEGTIPANTGVLLAGAEGSYELAIAEGVAAIEDNLLSGSVASEYVATTSYVLSKPADSEVGFYLADKNQQEGTSWLNNGFKAYLPAGESTVKAFFFNFDGNTTAIESVVAPVFDANAPIYDLSGRRVLNAVKGGLYIQNGKKFIVK